MSLRAAHFSWKIEAAGPSLTRTLTAMSTSGMSLFDRTMLHPLWAEGWFAFVVGTEEDRVTVSCEMFSRDYDDETREHDILHVDVTKLCVLTMNTEGCSRQIYVKDVRSRRCVVCGKHPDGQPSGRIPCPAGCGSMLPPSFRSVSKFNGVFELREEGPAALLDQRLPESWGYKDMPSDMAAAIAAVILPSHFPQEAEFMRAWAEEEEAELKAMREKGYPEGEEERLRFWAGVKAEAAALRAAGDQWGAMRVEREGVDKMIGWVNPPPEDDHTIPEPKLEDMVPQHGLFEDEEDEEEDEDEEDEDEDDFLPDGAHLLPQDFQDFLCRWNKTITDSTGDWLGEPRKRYKRENPETWKEFLAENKRLEKLYPTELTALKAYQASLKA